jgi:hypothetical protein
MQRLARLSAGFRAALRGRRRVPRSVSELRNWNPRAPPTGPNRLYPAILPESADIDALIGAGSQSHAVADVSALVRELRGRASAFGAYDYRIEP